MNFQIVKPNAFLCDYVKQYCFMETHVDEGNIIERVIPADYVQLMFHYRNPFVVVKDEILTHKQPRTIISGLSNSYSDVSTFGEAGVVFVQFKPAGACQFFKFPLSEIENKSFNLADIFYTEVKELEEKLFETNTVTGKVQLIETFLLSKFSPIPNFDKLFIDKGIQLIKQCGGQITAKKLAEIMASTPKSLERKFGQYLGKTPKQYIKLVRFYQTLTDLSLIKNINFTEFAFRNGYFDQAHFIRDFKNFSGYTPKEFVSKYPEFYVD